MLITCYYHMQILRSLSYINRYPDNRVTDGQRMLSIMATDTSGADSNSISVDITVADRNDGPVVDVGGGDSMDFVTTFVENGGSIPIGISTNSSYFQYTKLLNAFSMVHLC